MELYKYLIADDSKILILLLQLLIGIGFVFFVSLIMHSKKNSVPSDGNNEMFVLISFIQSNLGVNLGEGLKIIEENNKQKSHKKSLIKTTIELFFLAPQLGYYWLNSAKKVSLSKFRHPLERAQILMQALGIVLANIILAIIVTTWAVYVHGDTCQSNSLHSVSRDEEKKECEDKYSNQDTKESTNSIQKNNTIKGFEKLPKRYSLTSFLKNSDFWLKSGYGLLILYFLLSFLAAILAIVLLVKRQAEWKEFWIGELGKIFRKSVIINNYDLYNQCHNLNQSIQKQPVIPLSQMHQVIVLVVGFTQMAIPVIVPFVVSMINNLVIIS